jgi:hypothetical protein
VFSKKDREPDHPSHNLFGAAKTAEIQVRWVGQFW